MSDPSRPILSGGYQGAIFGTILGAIGTALLVAIVCGTFVAVTPAPPDQSWSWSSLWSVSRMEAVVLLAFMLAFPGAFVGAVIGAIVGVRRCAQASEKATKEAIQKKQEP